MKWQVHIIEEWHVYVYTWHVNIYKW